MAFIPAPNIVQVELRCSLAGQNIENRFHVNAMTAVTSANLAEITNLVSVWAQASYFDHLPNAVSLREVVGTDLTIQNGDQHTIVPAGPVVGGLITAAMPNEVTFCIQHRSVARGRSARGRSYVLAIAKNEVTGNDLSTARADSFVSDFVALGGALGSSGFLFTIVSYVANGAPRPGGPVYFEIVASSYADTLVDSMRRRKPGVGQ